MTFQPHPQAPGIATWMWFQVPGSKQMTQQKWPIQIDLHYVEKNVCQTWPPNKSRVQWIGECKHVVSCSLSMCWFWGCKWLEVALRLMSIWLKWVFGVDRSPPETISSLFQRHHEFPYAKKGLGPKYVQLPSGTNPAKPLASNVYSEFFHFDGLGMPPAMLHVWLSVRPFRTLLLKYWICIYIYNPKDCSANCSPSLWNIQPRIWVRPPPHAPSTSIQQKI